MITRDVAQLRTVVGIAPSSFDASCGSLNGDSTGNGVLGLIIDRLGLGRGYNSLDVQAYGVMEGATSTLDAKFGAVYAWLYHSSTTCAADFDRFSTDSERSRGIAFMLNATSTLAGGFMATSTSVGTFGTFSATATGGARAEYDAPYSLAGAGRFVRVLLFAEAYASSSGGQRFSAAGANLVFGEPDEAPRRTTSTGQPYLS